MDVFAVDGARHDHLHSRIMTLMMTRILMALFLAAGSVAHAAPPMLRAEPQSGFDIEVLFSVGDTVGDYLPPGVLDGMAAFALDETTVRLFVNHELAPTAGSAYRLANGTTLRGARVSYFDIERHTRRIRRAGLAYSSVVDRTGRMVSDAAQISERPGKAVAGFSAFCSAAGYARGDSGFADDIFFTHEEASAADGRHPHGGSVWALEVRAARLWAVPALGRGSWENVVAVTTPDGERPDGHVALLLGDDFFSGAAPLYLWLGRKNPQGNFLERNGLAEGRLYAWAAASAERTPQQWRGSGSQRQGRFIALAHRNGARPGTKGYDGAGYPDDTTLRHEAASQGAFLFARPEDLHANPADRRQIVFSATGQGEVYPADDWGNLYLAELRFPADPAGGYRPEADLTLLYDSDDTADRGIRNPDNLVWATDGNIYVQEDPATAHGRFGATSQREASIWQLSPAAPATPRRIAEIDRRALPPGTSDARAATPGAWESSGILDVSALFGAVPGELVLLATVQAHTVTDGPIGGAGALVQSGQLLWLTRPVNSEH